MPYVIYLLQLNNLGFTEDLEGEDLLLVLIGTTRWTNKTDPSESA